MAIASTDINSLRPETINVLTAMVAAGSMISRATKDAIDQLIDTLIRVGLWTTMDAFYAAALAPDAASACINWINPGTYDLVNHGATFVPGKGWQGNGTSAYLEAPIPLNKAGLKFCQASSQAFTFTTDSPNPTIGGEFYTLIGTNEASDIEINPLTGGGNFYGRICNGMQMAAPSTSRLGFRLVRGGDAGGGSGEAVLASNGIVVYDATTAGATPYANTTVSILGRAVGQWTADTVGIIGIGQATTSGGYAEIEGALCEALSAVGGLAQGVLPDTLTVSTLADVSKAVVPTTVQSVLVLGNTTIGDRRPFPLVRQAGDPGTASSRKSADGAWWDDAQPTEFERVDLEYFLRRAPTRADGLLAACQALFQETTDQTRIKLVLDGQGIPITITSPFRLRSNKWPSGGNITFGGQQSTGHTAGRSLRNLHLIVPASGTNFVDGDDAFAIEGMLDAKTDAGTDSLYDFDIHDIIVDLQPYIAGGGSAKVNCFSMTGTHFASAYRLKFPTIPAGAYGFRQMAYDRLTGTKIVNTGLLIEDQNSTGKGDTTEHIHVEGSDVNLVKGHFGGRGIMVHTTYGQLTTRACHHAAAAPTGDRALSILADYPGDIHSIGDELDGGRILICNNPVNTFSNGSTPDFGAICIDGTEFNEAGVDCAAGRGFVTLSNFRTSGSPTKLTRFTYRPAWMPSGTSAPQLLINAGTSGTVGWNATGSQQLNFQPAPGPNPPFSGPAGFTPVTPWAGS